MPCHFISAIITRKTEETFCWTDAIDAVDKIVQYSDDTATWTGTALQQLLTFFSPRRTIIFRFFSAMLWMEKSMGLSDSWSSLKYIKNYCKHYNGPGIRSRLIQYLILWDKYGHIVIRFNFFSFFLHTSTVCGCALIDLKIANVLSLPPFAQKEHKRPEHQQYYPVLVISFWSLKCLWK